MQRDPTIIGRTNVMAETFAGVINSFVDPISWKTMVSMRLEKRFICRKSLTKRSHEIAGVHIDHLDFPDHFDKLGLMES